MIIRGDGGYFRRLFLNESPIYCVGSVALMGCFDITYSLGILMRVESVNSNLDVYKLLKGSFSSVLEIDGVGWRLYPTDTVEVSKAVKIGHQTKCRVVVTHGKELEVDRAEIMEEHIIIDLSRMNAIDSCDFHSMVVTAGACTKVKDLEVFLGDNGLTSGFIVCPEVNPSIISILTCENTSESSILYGRPIDRCIALEGVMCDGSIFREDLLVERLAGGDLRRLLIRSHGRWTIVTAVTVVVFKQPSKRYLTGCEVSSLSDGLSLVLELLSSGAGMSIGRLYSPGWFRRDIDGIDRGGEKDRWLLVVGIEGIQPIVDGWQRRIETATRKVSGRILGFDDDPFVSRFSRNPTRELSMDLSQVVVATHWNRVEKIYEVISNGVGDVLVCCKISDFSYSGLCMYFFLMRDSLSRKEIHNVFTMIRDAGGFVVRFDQCGQDGVGKVSSGVDFIAEVFDDVFMEAGLSPFELISTEP